MAKKRDPKLPKYDPNFRAVINGELVKYHPNSEFVIERKHDSTGRYTILGTRKTISEAIKKFHASMLMGHTVRLSAAHDGRVSPMIRRTL